MKSVYCFIFILISGLAQATDCVIDNPSFAAKYFYLRHVNFYNENPDKIKNLITPRFYTALTAEYKCTQPNKLCAIESVPWSDAQDGEIEEPIIFNTTNITNKNTSVKMSYIFALSKTQRQQQEVTLNFERYLTNGCWAISDIITPNGTSLVKFLEKWHKKINNGL